jgi:hypothetical protein
VVEGMTDTGAIFALPASGTADGFAKSVTVDDDAAAPLFTIYQQLGGPAAIGYPASDRFQLAGSTQVSQVFGSTIVSYDASTGAVTTILILDALQAFGTVPPVADWTADLGKSPDEIVAAHLALLDDYPLLQAFAADPATQAAFGLPLGIAVDDQGKVTVRTENGVFHLSADGAVSAADIMTEAGLVPDTSGPLDAADAPPEATDTDTQPLATPDTPPVEGQ